MFVVTCQLLFANHLYCQSLFPGNTSKCKNRIYSTRYITWKQCIVGNTSTHILAVISFTYFLVKAQLIALMFNFELFNVWAWLTIAVDDQWWWIHCYSRQGWEDTNQSLSQCLQHTGLLSPSYRVCLTHCEGESKIVTSAPLVNSTDKLKLKLNLLWQFGKSLAQLTLRKSFKRYWI